MAEHDGGDGPVGEQPPLGLDEGEEVFDDEDEEEEVFNDEEEEEFDNDDEDLPLPLPVIAAPPPLPEEVLPWSFGSGIYSPWQLSIPISNHWRRAMWRSGRGPFLPQFTTDGKEPFLRDISENVCSVRS